MKLVRMPLKPGYTTLETDPTVIETSGLTSTDPTTMLLGSIWDLTKDTLKNINYYKLSGKSLKSLAGKHLKDINPDDLEPDMVT